MTNPAYQSAKALAYWGCSAKDAIVMINGIAAIAGGIEVIIAGQSIPLLLSIPAGPGGVVAGEVVVIPAAIAGGAIAIAGGAVVGTGAVMFASDRQSFNQAVDLLRENCSFVNGIKAKNIRKQSAEDANAFWKNENYKDPPYKPGTETTIFEVTEDTKFVRVYDGITSGPYGRWFMKSEDIEGLTPKQIQSKFALEYEPKYVTDVIVKEGTTIRTGVANSLYGQSGGGIQFDFMNQYVGEFLNEKPLK